MPISDAKKKADNAWRKRALESISIRVRKGTREIWRQAADRAGMSLAAYIQTAIQEKMDRDKEDC